MKINSVQLKVYRGKLKCHKEKSQKLPDGNKGLVQKMHRIPYMSVCDHHNMGKNRNLQMAKMFETRGDVCEEYCLVRYDCIEYREDC